LAGRVDRRVIELDLEGQHVAVVRLETGPFQAGPLALAHLDRLQHPDEALGCVLQFDARALQQEDETRRRAVEHRHLVGGDVDGQVVQAQAGAGRQQVLDGLYLRRTGVAAGADGRGHACIADRLRVDRDADRLRQVGATKDDPAVDRRGLESELDLLAAVHAHADRPGDGFQGPLLQHVRDCPARRKTLRDRGRRLQPAPGRGEARRAAERRQQALGCHRRPAIAANQRCRVAAADPALPVRQRRPL
jgi:hypothetical protein